MNILAFDTSGEATSVALACNSDILQKCEAAPRKQAELVLPMVQAILAEAGISMQQLDGLALTIGPGAFTGLRVGIGIVQGMSFALSLPVVGVSTLATLAQGAYRRYQTPAVIAAIDARMKEIYWGSYFLSDSGIMAPIHADRISTPEELIVPAAQTAQWVGAGSGWSAYAHHLPTCPSYAALMPEAQDVLTLAQAHFASGNTWSAEQVMPVYLRDQVVK